MLADHLVEEFEMKEDEPWYDHRDLQQDLQLAAELGKTLLDRNTELEDSLQQMYTTNQEQLQEIEYLSKQVELLRQMNEQHAKVYEQLDVTARDLEETNQKLVADSKASQQKILSLTETIECLQTNIDHLQGQVEELKTSSQGQRPRPSEARAAPAFACLKELYDLRQHFVYDHVFAEKIASLQSQQSPEEEENAHLQRAVAALQAQLGAERRKRAALEEELGLVLAENRELEQRLRGADACRARALELEAEVADMRQRLRAEHPFAGGVEKLVPDALFVPFKEPGQSLLEEIFLGTPEAPRRPLKRSSSETVLSSSAAGADAAGGHEHTCIRRAKAVRQRGVSLLHEVDSQYSALKEKYEALLRRCQPEPDSLSHKAVQTSRALAAREPAAGAPEPPRGPPSPGTPPEYKALFQEIFSCIKKTKQEIDEQRTKYRSLSAQPPPAQPQPGAAL
ncbi:cerebellar degeneration-related protein 2 [Dipodomys spectabilis]|uniref:cerebellar degeneration-related protein 2 n=1 Tax=Dipodomys spectabilis TaxID=105255 RepID=UPI001C53BCE0|nr:cerebellar degeneration-related protein 2 [Dipodomys spectabilis]